MEKARQRQITIFAVLSVLVIGFIFGNSLPSIEESRAQSGILVELLRRILDPFEKWPEAEFHRFVRKMAHLTEFGLLGACLGGLTDGLKPDFWRSVYMFFVLFSVLAVAVTDEFIQSFTGRGSMVADVVLDFAGGTLGLLGMCICLTVLRRLLKREG